MKTNSLFILSSDTHRKLVEGFIYECFSHECRQMRYSSENAFKNATPWQEDGDAILTSRDYDGDAFLYRQLAARMLKDLPLQMDNDWHEQSATAVYVYFEKAQILAMALQSITEPDKFSTGALDNDNQLFGKGILCDRPRIEGDKPMSGLWNHYMKPEEPTRLIIISDCFDVVRNTEDWGHLTEEAMDSAEEVCVMKPDATLRYFESIKEARAKAIDQRYTIYKKATA